MVVCFILSGDGGGEGVGYRTMAEVTPDLGEDSTTPVPEGWSSTSHCSIDIFIFNEKFALCEKIMMSQHITSKQSQAFV